MFKKFALALLTLPLLATTIVPAGIALASTSNLIANPSVEMVSGTGPTAWSQGQWGTNAATFTYESNSGHTGKHSLYINMKTHTDGDAKWYFAPVAVTPNTTYSYSEFYKSSVATEIDAQYTDTTDKLSYAVLANPTASATTWHQTSITFTTPSNVTMLTIFHLIDTVGTLQTDDFSLSTTPKPVAPTVSLTSPTPNSTVSGTATISANATDPGGIKSIQFKLDGANLGTPLTATPYTLAWDTTAAANGNHTLTAVATNTANVSTTSSSLTINVNNVVTPTPGNGSNLIPNPSLEATQDAATPQGWLASNWGTNTSTFMYLNTGHTGRRSVEVATTAYTNGAANWYYNDVPVTAGKTYEYTNWYKSNVDTEVDAEVTMNDGTVQYYWLGSAIASPTWTKFTATFTVPAGAKSMAAYQILAKVGYIVSDDYSLSEYTPLPFARGIVSVSFDDGWANQYQNAYPVMQQDGLIGTYNIISGELTDQPDYMSLAMLKTLLANGNEIASHSVTHPDLTALSQTALVQEMSQSQATLQHDLGVPITDFAYPYGAYNGNTIAVGKQYYQSQRSVNAGYNSKDNLDLTQLKIYEVDSNISQAQVQGWIEGAVQQHTWLILVYHEIATAPVDPSDALYDTQPSDFAAEMAYLQHSGAAVETVHQAISEILPQL